MEAGLNVDQGVDLGTAWTWIRARNVLKPGSTPLKFRPPVPTRSSEGSQPLGESSQLIVLTHCSVDPTTRRVDGGDVRPLTRRECDVLVYLFERAGHLVTNEALLTDVWGAVAHNNTTTVATTMYRLRKKVERDPRRPDHIITVHGQGYRFQPNTRGDVANSRSTEQGLFIGRTAEMAEVVRRVSDPEGNPVLVTLTGPPGVGKTALVRRIGRKVMGPALVVNLANVTDPAEVAGAVAAVVGGSPAPSALAHTLHNHNHPLVVVDNAEHVIEGVSDLIGNVPARWLVASRVVCGLPDEQVVRLDPLSPAEACLLYRTLADDDHSPDAVVAQLLDQLGAVPLAIEIAASRAALFSPQELTKRLKSSHAVISKQGLPGRFAHLDAAIKLSWMGLSPMARSALVHCAVLEGSFQRGLVQGWFGDERARALDELLQASLVSLVPGMGQRLQILPSIRHFANGHPDHREDRMAAINQLTSEMVTGAKAAISTFITEDSWLFTHRYNLSAALAHLRSDALVGRTWLQAAVALLPGRGQSTLVELNRILAEFGEERSDPCIGAARSARAELLRRLDQHEASAAEWGSLYTESPPGIARQLSSGNLCFLRYCQGDLARGADWLERFAESGAAAAEVCFLRGWAQCARDDWGASRAWFRQGASIANRPTLKYHLLQRLGQTEWKLGHMSASVSCFEEALAVCVSRGDRVGSGVVHGRMATSLALDEEFERAEWHLSRAVVYLEDSPIGKRIEAEQRGLVAILNGDFEAAVIANDDCLCLFPRSYTVNRVRAMLNKSAALCALRRPAEALASLESMSDLLSRPVANAATLVNVLTRACEIMLPIGELGDGLAGLVHEVEHEVAREPRYRHLSCGVIAALSHLVDEHDAALGRYTDMVVGAVL